MGASRNSPIIETSKSERSTSPTCVVPGSAHVQAATLEFPLATSPRVAGEDHGDAPRISDEEAVAFALLYLETGGSHPLAHRLDLLRVAEQDCPVVQTYPARWSGRYVLAAPHVEAEVMMVAAGRHERGRAGHEIGRASCRERV